MRVRKRFQWRAFATILLFLSMLAVALSGVYLYTPGFIASVINLNFLGINFRQWAILHTVFALVFVLLAAWHIVYNWRPLLNYLKGKARQAFRYRRELLLSLGIALFFSVTSAVDWPPSSTIWNYRYALRKVWVAWGFSHMTVADLAKNRHVPVEVALKRLKKYGLKAEAATNLAELASASKYTAYDLYLIVSGRKPESSR